MSEKVIAASLKLDSEAANNSVKSFKAQLKEATNELHKMGSIFGETSKEAVNAAKRVAELKDKIGDAKALVDGFNPDRKFQAFGNAIRGVAGGFSALQGTMALLGSQSEDTQKALLKVQAALAISDGVNNILELKDTFRQLGAFIQSTTAFQKVNTVVTKIAAVTMRFFGGSVDATSTSFKFLKGAIAATGIGVLVLLLSEAAEAMGAFSTATEDASETQAKLKAEIEQTKSALDDLMRSNEDFIKRGIKFTKNEEAIKDLQAQGAGLKEINKLKRENIEIEIQNKKVEFETKKGLLTPEEDYNIKKDIFVKERELKRLDIEETKANADKLKQLNDKNREKAKAAAEKAAQELKQLQEEEKRGLEQLSKARQENTLSKIADEEKRAIQSAKFEFINAQKSINALKISEDLKTELIAAALEKRNLNIEEIQKDASKKKAEKDQEDFEKELEFEQQYIDQQIEYYKQIDEIKKNLNDEGKDDYTLRLEKLQEEYDAKLKIIGNNEELIYQLTESYEKQKTEITRQENNAKLKIVTDVLGIAADLVGKQTAAGKALGIASAVINTYIGATEVLRAKSVLPEPFGTIAKIVNVGAIIATGFKAVKAIVATPVPGGGGSSAPSLSTVAAPLAPSIPTNVQTQLNANAINSTNNAAVPIQAYVVESQSADAKERISRLNRAARLGG